MARASEDRAVLLESSDAGVLRCVYGLGCRSAFVLQRNSSILSQHVDLAELRHWTWDWILFRKTLCGYLAVVTLHACFVHFQQKTGQDLL